jgi:hypothetical protein
MEIALSQAIEQFIRQSRFSNDIRALQIEEVWEKLMGRTISKYTEKIRLVNSTLFITTSVAPLKNELHFQKEQIKMRINEELGEALVKDVVIQ